MTVGHFHIPGKATKREYAVYVMVARRRKSGKFRLYVGKTGDNRDGCNPVISRAGNHFSFNKIHSQMRNKLPGEPAAYEFDFFSTTFGRYVEPKVSRRGIDLINEMERRLNHRIQKEFGKERLLNPLAGTGHVTRPERKKRDSMATPKRLRQLEELVEAVQEHLSG